MQSYRTIVIIGTIEILIGLITVLLNIVTLLLLANDKSPNVLAFVIIAGCLSTLIGVGLLKFHKKAYDLLLYFSSVIILSKVLIIFGIIQLNGALETTVPGPVKSSISILYHSFILYYLKRPDIKSIFHD